MPCSGSRTWDELAKEEENQAQIAKVKQECKKEIDILTEMLCNLCSKVDLNTLDSPVKEWYQSHLKEDVIRIVNSFNRKSDKLTGAQWRAIEEILDSIEE